MEVKINRKIRNYTEYMFSGLPLRQLIFSVLACSAAAGLSEFLIPKHLLFRAENLYYETLKTNIKKREKEGIKKHGKNT